jgi:subtilisin family serine protease
MLGVSAGPFHYQADIINLSFGLPLGKRCPTCGAGASVSKVFWRFLRSISKKPVAPGGPPILIAATGNNGVSSGFDAPAQWKFTVAVGSINQKKERSSFSNYGTSGHSQHIMMFGGDENGGTITEWVGEATQKCVGTSAAAAYASGVLALYMTNTSYQHPDRAQFLQNVLSKCQFCRNHNSTECGKGYLEYR